MHTNIPLCQPPKASRSWPRAAVCLPTPTDLETERTENTSSFSRLCFLTTLLQEKPERTPVQTQDTLGGAQGQWASGVWSSVGEREK